MLIWLDLNFQLCSLESNVDCPWAAQPSCAQVNSGDVPLKDLFLLPAPPYQKSPPFTCFLMIECLEYTCECLDDHAVWHPTLSNVTYVCYHQNASQICPLPCISSAITLANLHRKFSPFLSGIPHSSQGLLGFQSFTHTVPMSWNTLPPPRCPQMEVLFLTPENRQWLGRHAGFM